MIGYKPVRSCLATKLCNISQLLGKFASQTGDQNSFEYHYSFFKVANIAKPWLESLNTFYWHHSSGNKFDFDNLYDIFLMQKHPTFEINATFMQMLIFKLQSNVLRKLINAKYQPSDVVL